MQNSGSSGFTVEQFRGATGKGVESFVAMIICFNLITEWIMVKTAYRLAQRLRSTICFKFR